MASSACPGCGLVLPEHDGPTHDYIGASPACWALYGRLLAREYGEYGMPPEHKFTVDAYAAQHPGVDERRSRQSVAVHLMRICAMIERGRDAGFATRMMSRATNSGVSFPWFDPPLPVGTLTVADMLEATSLDQHVRLVRDWASDVWQAYAPQHDLIRGWCDGVELQLAE